MWDSLRSNLPMKITSLLLAVLLWGMVAGQDVKTRELNVPLELPELPDTLMHRRSPPEVVGVRFRATGRRLFWFRILPPRLRPPVRLVATAEADTIWLNKDYLTLPRAFDGEVERFEPPFIEIQLLEVIEKQIPVKAQVDREPRHPYLLDEAEGLVLEPSSVIARGPREKLSQMPWVRTEILDLQDETESGEKELGLLGEDPQISFKPEKVKVRYRISLWEGD